MISVRVEFVYGPMGACGSVRVSVRVLTNGSSWFGACLGACTDRWELVVRCVFGVCLGACWVVLVEREVQREVQRKSEEMKRRERK